MGAVCDSKKDSQTESVKPPPPQIKPQTHIEELPLKEDLTDESLDSMVKSINVSSLGKFFINTDKYKRKKEIYKQYLNNVKAKED